MTSTRDDRLRDALTRRIQPWRDEGLPHTAAYRVELPAAIRDAERERLAELPPEKAKLAAKRASLAGSIVRTFYDALAHHARRLGIEHDGENLADRVRQYLIASHGWTAHRFGGATLGEIVAALAEVKTPATIDETPKHSMSGEARAVALLYEHPDWTQKQIAEAAGLARTSLNRFPKYQAARIALKSGRHDRRRGYRDARTGDIEAES